MCCNKKLNEKLRKRVFNTYKLSNLDDIKFILSLQKDPYPHEYMDDWKFVEDFYSQLNMEDITDADYAHTKRVCRDFEIKNLGENHDLYVQNDTLLLANVFENFRNIRT